MRTQVSSIIELKSSHLIQAINPINKRSFKHKFQATWKLNPFDSDIYPIPL